MAFSYVLGGEIREDRLCPCFFLYGEETYLADEFVRQLKDALISPDGQRFNLERFALEDTRWADLIDLARTIPFFFSPWRIVVVEIRADSDVRLSPLEESIIKDYFRSPSSRTVLVVILAGKVKKSHPLVRFFSRLPASSVCPKEIRPLKEENLSAWMDKRFEERGKLATPEAKRRLEEIIGNDLRRLINELEKIVNFAAEKKVIDIDDVNQVCDWVKTFVQWELSSSLEKADLRQTLLILNQLFKEGVKAEHILSVTANFFRDILAAKVWLRENRDKKEVFSRLRPHIDEKFSFYPARFKEFFSLVEGLSLADLRVIIAELERIDSLIKTSDTSAQVLLEGFAFSYCRKRIGQQKGKTGFTLREKG
jgi:DNA polymerase III delta subunit